MITLSPSSLNLFLESPRDFYKEKVLKIKRPRGIFASLPGGIDRIMKDYFDSFRGILPSVLETNPLLKESVLYSDAEALKKIRHWKSGLKVKRDNWILQGALDDLLYDQDLGKYIPFDVKTKGSEPNEADAIKYYKNQLDCYSLMLNENGYPAADFGVLFFIYPESVWSNTDTPDFADIRFLIKMFNIKTSMESAEKICNDAADCLSGPIPPPEPGNEWDKYIEESTNV